MIKEIAEMNLANAPREAGQGSVQPRKEVKSRDGVVTLTLEGARGTLTGRPEFARWGDGPLMWNTCDAAVTCDGRYIAYVEARREADTVVDETTDLRPRVWILAREGNEWKDFAEFPLDDIRGIQWEGSEDSPTLLVYFTDVEPKRAIFSEGRWVLRKA